MLGVVLSCHLLSFGMTGCIEFVVEIEVYSVWHTFGIIYPLLPSDLLIAQMEVT